MKETGKTEKNMEREHMYMLAVEDTLGNLRLINDMGVGDIYILMETFMKATLLLEGGKEKENTPTQKAKNTTEIGLLIEW